MASRVGVWVLEDQLRADSPAFREAGPDAPIFMVESDTHWRQWPFHTWRITFLASAMRHFAGELREAGRDVHYYPLREKSYRDSISAFKHYVKTTGCDTLHVTDPADYHTKAWIETLPDLLRITINFFPNRLFLTDRQKFTNWVEARKKPVMEFFYRDMRRTHGLLMDGDAPAGGTWNLDKLNRKTPPSGTAYPELPGFPPDDLTRDVIDEVKRRFPDHPGDPTDFDLPVTRADAGKAFDAFVRDRLPLFGDYEDAMVTGEPFLHHSMVSAPLNAALLDPLTLCRKVEKAWKSGHAPLNAAEGFIRQIIGWREYVYGIYWAFMPDYRRRNPRRATRPLPASFWTGDTDLNCLKQALDPVIRRGYSHHIQRLMVICNFATLAGLSPQAVNDWFLEMYADSHDWVTTPNVIGMAMNSDGGVMATKPYVSTAAYINRMSDYCADCRYDPKKRTGDDACPFNYLYWTFLNHYRDDYAKNPRMAMILKNLDRIPVEEMQAMMTERRRFIRVNVPARAGAKARSPA